MVQIVSLNPPESVWEQAFRFQAVIPVSPFRHHHPFALFYRMFFSQLNKRINDRYSHGAAALSIRIGYVRGQ
jgi:hypothetical protein